MSLILLNTFRAGSCPTWKPNSPNLAGLVSSQSGLPNHENCQPTETFW